MLWTNFTHYYILQSITIVYKLCKSRTLDMCVDDINLNIVEINRVYNEYLDIFSNI